MDRSPIQTPATETLIAAWGSIPPASQVSAFLALDDARRTVAIARIGALQALTSGDARPSRPVQAAAAAELGIGLKRLQMLMRSWLADQTIAAVVPRAVTHRRRARSAGGLDVARRLAAKIVARNRWTPEPTARRLMSRVLKRLGLPVPARATVARMLETARRAEPDMGFADPPGVPADGADTALPGSHLLLVDQHFAARVGRGDETVQANALILFDLTTGFVVGWSARHALGEIVDEAARALFSPDAWSLGPWTAPRELRVAADLEEQNRLRLHEGAERLGVIVVASRRTHAQRYATDILSGDGPTRSAPRQKRSAPSASWWPLLHGAEFEMELGRVVDRSRNGSERRWDLGPRRPASGNEEFVAALTLLLGD